MKKESYHLRCISCKQTYKSTQNIYVCPKCGERLGTLEVVYNYQDIHINLLELRGSDGIEQYRALLPIDDNTPLTSLKVGGTPLYSYKNLLGIKEVLIKYEGGNPTGSYKDRATAIAISKAKEESAKAIYCASTGNAASSLAGLNAITDMDTYIFLPAKAPLAKLAQLYVFGAKVIKIDASYDEVFDLSMEIGKRYGWYCRNSAINPYLLEGKKTCAYEIIVQNNWQVPNVVVVGVGDGTVISSLYKGFYDFYQLGLINEIPQIIGVQAKGACSVYRAFNNCEESYIQDMKANTIADSISVGKPRDVVKACKYVKKSRGTIITVSDEEIIESIHEMAVNTGVFGEPAGAISYAGMKKIVAENEEYRKKSICLVVSGNGLKDIQAIERLIKKREFTLDINEICAAIETGEL